MFNIFASNSYKNGAFYIMNQLSKVNKKDLSHRHILIVPDRASLSAEQLMLSSVGGSFNIEVLTFRRYANKLSSYGNYLKKQSAVMVLSSLILRNKDKLGVFCKGVETLSFAEGVYDIICQLKYARISPEMLQPSAYPLAVCAKMEDVKLIYTLYEEYLQKGFIDSAQKLENLISLVKEHPDVPNTYFYLADFEMLSAQEVEIIGQLALHSKGVTVACCYSDKSFHSHIYPNNVYHALLEQCKKIGIEPFVQSNYSFDSQMERAIGENLFAYDKGKVTDLKYALQKAKQSPVAVNIVGGVTQEVTALAQDICIHVRNGGKYGDYYVVASDVERYKMAIERVFADHDIPFFAEEKLSLAQHPAGQFVVDFLAARRNNFRRENVIPVVKNYFFCHDESVFVFDNYCLKYNASYDFSQFVFGRDDKQVDFATADRVRQNFFALCQQYDFLPQDDGAKFAHTVKRMVEEVILPQIEDFCLECDDEKMSKASQQVCEKFVLLLDEYAQTFSGNNVRYEEFCKVLSVGMESVTLSVLPIVSDCVVITNMGKSRKHDINVLALLGANTGDMPIIKKDTKLLSDENLRQLESCGVCLDCLICDENKREKFNVFQLLHEPKRLIVCASDKHSEGETGQISVPSQFVYNLCDIFSVEGVPLKPCTRVRDDEIFTRRLGVISAVNAFRTQNDGGKITSPRFDLVKKHFGNAVTQYQYDTICQPYLKNKQTLTKTQETTVSKAESFYSCPLKHFFRYGLDIKLRLASKLNSNDLGDILHDTLERFVKRFKNDYTEKQTEALAIKCFLQVLENDYYKAISLNLSQKLALANLQKECVALALQIREQFCNSDFVCYGAEVEFGSEKQLPSLNIANTAIRGKIDRIDSCEEQFLCVDYKSGSWGVDYSESALYVGEKLQLPLYVKAVAKALNKQNVGFYYYRLHDNFIKANKKRYFYTGRSVDDRKILYKIDRRLQSDGASALLGIKINKNGEIRSTSSVVDSRQLDAQPEYACLLLEAAARLCEKGYCPPSPYSKGMSSSCDYCDYKTICFAHDLYPNGTRKEVKGIVAQDILDIVEANKGQSKGKEGKK